MSVRSLRYSSLLERFPKSNVASTDRDALAFIAAAGIYNTNQQKAIKTLVRDLKMKGLWSKMKAIYPFVGGTATSHKWNLKDPQDTDAAFRLSFSGGWTHSANGADPNGTNAYANTYFVANGNLNLYDGHLSYYARENITVTGTTQALLGVGSNTGVWNSKEAWFIEFASTNTNYSQHSTSPNSDRARVPNSISMLGFNLGTRLNSTGSTLKLFQNNTLKAQASTSIAGQALNIYSVYLASFNNRTAGGPDYASNYTSNQCAFASIGVGLTDTEASNLYYAVQRYQKILGRAIDPDTQAFIDAAGITDQTQKDAITNLVASLKSDGLWSKMKAIYPFVGGTATSHKWNLKDPRDADAAFRLTFSGGWTHSSTGATPNATNAYADTFWNTQTNGDKDSGHLSYYSRTNNTANNIEIGSYTPGASASYTYILQYTASIFVRDYRWCEGGTVTRVNNPATTTGYLIANRNSSTVGIGYRNDTKEVTTSSTSSATSTTNVWIAAANYGGSILAPTNRQCAFATIGDGLTDTDSSNLYNAVQRYQTQLGRQV